jgi:hypothetical protein
VIEDTVYGGQITGHTMYVISRVELDMINVNLKRCYQNFIRINTADRMSGQTTNYIGYYNTFCLKNYTFLPVTAQNNDYPEWINFWSDLGYNSYIFNGNIANYNIYGYLEKLPSKLGVYKNNQILSSSDGGVPTSYLENSTVTNLNVVVNNNNYSVLKNVKGTVNSNQGGTLYIDNVGLTKNVADSITYVGNNVNSEFYVNNALVRLNTMTNQWKKHILKNSIIGGGGIYFQGISVGTWMASSPFVAEFTDVVFADNKQINPHYNFPIVSDSAFTKAQFDNYASKHTFNNVTADINASNYLRTANGGLYSSFYNKLSV